MAVLLQGVSRQLFKNKLHKKADMNKVNGKFPNCFQPVKLFFSMSSCLPSFVSKGLRGRRENQEWWNPPLQQRGLIHAKKPRSNRVKPTQFQGQIDLLFGTDLYFMETHRIATLSLNVQLDKIGKNIINMYLIPDHFTASIMYIVK